MTDLRPLFHPGRLDLDEVPDADARTDIRARAQMGVWADRTALTDPRSFNHAVADGAPALDRRRLDPGVRPDHAPFADRRGPDEVRSGQDLRPWTDRHVGIDVGALRIADPHARVHKCPGLAQAEDSIGLRQVDRRPHRQERQRLPSRDCFNTALRRPVRDNEPADPRSLQTVVRLPQHGAALHTADTGSRFIVCLGVEQREIGLRLAVVEEEVNEVRRGDQGEVRANEENGPAPDTLSGLRWRDPLDAVEIRCVPQGVIGRIDDNEKLRGVESEGGGDDVSEHRPAAGTVEDLCLCRAHTGSRSVGQDDYAQVLCHETPALMIRDVGRTIQENPLAVGQRAPVYSGASKSKEVAMTADVFSGIQPTGTLHIGNYFGAIRNWAALQADRNCVYCIVDYHAITIEVDPQTLRDASRSMALDLVACGIDPDRSILFVQSAVPEHVELAWILSCVTSYGDLTRMTQFKDKSASNAFVSAGLFNYPVLQAADILLYRAAGVPVGEDQVQHLELSRRIARRFNARFGEFFSEPEPIVGKGARIMSLSDPTQKMSKSAGEAHYIGVMEDEASIRRKVRSAVTDTGLTPGEEMSPGVATLFEVLDLSADPETVAGLRREFEAGTLMYSSLKDAVFEHLMDILRPIQARRAALEAQGAIDGILADGARKARAIARETMTAVRRMAGLA